MPTEREGDRSTMTIELSPLYLAHIHLLGLPTAIPGAPVPLTLNYVFIFALTYLLTCWPTALPNAIATSYTWLLST